MLKALIVFYFVPIKLIIIWLLLWTVIFIAIIIYCYCYHLFFLLLLFISYNYTFFTNVNRILFMYLFIFPNIIKCYCYSSRFWFWFVSTIIHVNFSINSCCYILWLVIIFMECKNLLKMFLQSCCFESNECQNYFSAELRNSLKCRNSSDIHRIRG